MSFFSTFKDYVKADPDIVESRIKECSNCPFLGPKFRCSQCGCFMKIKTLLGPAKCPIGKW